MNRFEPKKKSGKIPDDFEVSRLKNDIVNSIVNQQPSEADPDGSYTGKPTDPFEKPIQDADDL